MIFSTRRQTSHLGSVLTSQKKSKPKSSHKKIETPDNQNQNRADKYSKLILLDQSGSNFIPISIGLLRPAVLDATFENQASMNSGQNMRRYGRQDSNVEGGRGGGGQDLVLTDKALICSLLRISRPHRSSKSPPDSSEGDGFSTITLRFLHYSTVHPRGRRYTTYR